MRWVGGKGEDGERGELTIHSIVVDDVILE